MGLFLNRTKRDGKTGVPVWFMRQAGRYHDHYQNIKSNSNFMQMCIDSDLACEVTMGPLLDFDFDAAILFSDLLFPLQNIGMGLSYESGPPTLSFHLENASDYKRLTSSDKDHYNFQKEAVKKLRAKMDSAKSLIGFTGAPFTLFTYACEGAHKGNLINSKLSLYDGRYSSFCKIIEGEIINQLLKQIEGGADAVALFDTAAGELALYDYKEFVIPSIARITKKIKELSPETKVIYYAKMVHEHYYEALTNQCQCSIDVLGIDWRCDLVGMLNRFGDRYYIQGNIDPCWLFLPSDQLQKNILDLWKRVTESKADCSKWIMGLGHGVLPKTPQENVRLAVKTIHDKFLYN